MLHPFDIEAFHHRRCFVDFRHHVRQHDALCAKAADNGDFADVQVRQSMFQNGLDVRLTVQDIAAFSQFLKQPFLDKGLQQRGLHPNGGKPLGMSRPRCHAGLDTQ